MVIDQFEQWLHGKTDKDRRELLAALRQCDGVRLQCLLMVRDDFWLAVGRFMTDLEIDLVQGHNAALVDLFDRQHARKVLAELGRAYGRLPNDLQSLESAQEAFLQKAITGLVQEDRVIPVRLALFAEMVKGKPWSPETLREMGGAEGVGVTFLEETFSARTANPRYRLHEEAVRAVLGALLPARGTDIRGRVCSNAELLDISGYGKKPRAFKELMRILDSETRLLTPMDLDAIDSQDLRATPGSRYYQLTHDYLVPSLATMADGQTAVDAQRSPGIAAGGTFATVERQSRGAAAAVAAGVDFDPPVDASLAVDGGPAPRDAGRLAPSPAIVAGRGRPAAGHSRGRIGSHCRHTQFPRRPASAHGRRVDGTGDGRRGLAVVATEQ